METLDVFINIYQAFDGTWVFLKELSVTCQGHQLGS